MTSAILMAALACGPASFINKTKYPRNERDNANLLIATKRCGTLYRKSPCLKFFIKIGERDYHAICSKEGS